MEVTTVSSSPASPTEGDDLCETDVTNVAIHSVTLLICLCGLAGNAAVLRLHGLKDCNAGIFDMAFADFVFLLFTVPSAILFLVEDVSCSSIVPLLYLSFLFQLSWISYYWVTFWLSTSHDINYIFKFCCRCHLSKRLLWLMDNVRFLAFYALLLVSPTVSNLCPSQEQQHCRAALISMYAIILLLFAAPVLISITINIIKVKRGSKKQQPKTRDIVIFLIVFFVLLLSLCNILQQEGYTDLSSQFLFLLNCSHSSIKPFIYFLAGRCWRPCALSSLRLSLQRVFDEQEDQAAPSNVALVDKGV